MIYQKLCQFANISSLPDPTDKYKIEERIGEGTYGEVFRAIDLRTGKVSYILPANSSLFTEFLTTILPYRISTGSKVAVKVLENISESIEEIEEEFMILKNISYHPNLPRFYGLYLKKGKTTESDQLWLVMEVSRE